MSDSSDSTRPQRATPPPAPSVRRQIPAPRVLPDSTAYWEAAQQGRLLVKQCSDCGQAHFYPRDICPHCLSDRTVWKQSEGRGKIYSFSTTGGGEAFYTIALITLNEGVTMLSNLVDCDARRLAVGDSVRVVFRASDSGQLIPMFTRDCPT